jgi:hypothetical protein
MKRYIFIIINTLFALAAVAQTDTAAVAAPDSVAPARSTFTIGAVYANDAGYYGQKAINANPYIALAASYRLKSGLYFTGQAYRLLHDSSGIASAGSIGIGWDIKMSEKWSLDISYSHTFFPEYSPMLQAANANNASLTLSYKPGLNFSIGGDYAFGKTNDAFVTGGIGKDISLGSISKKDLVYFSPSFNVVAGTQHFYETYITEKRLRDSLLGGVLSPIFGTPTTEPETKTVSSTSFNLLSYNLKLPFSYNRSSYMIEAAYQLSVLSREAQLNPGKANSFLTLSFYYQF